MEDRNTFESRQNGNCWLNYFKDNQNCGKICRDENFCLLFCSVLQMSCVEAISRLDLKENKQTTISLLDATEHSYKACTLVEQKL